MLRTPWRAIQSWDDSAVTEEVMLRVTVTFRVLLVVKIIVLMTVLQIWPDMISKTVYIG